VAREGSTSVSDHLKKVPSPVRSIVQAARRTVKAVSPDATEIAYKGEPPRSKAAMWKLARYADDAGNVVGIGAFADHATLFFYRGVELQDASRLLQGGGKEFRFITLKTPADAQRPAVKQMVQKAFKLGGASKTKSGLI
jgi:hypothetical protein